jgi:glycosyltransferase involved in cell wall biosynthesis
VRIMVLSPYLPHRRIGHGGGTAVRAFVRHLSRRHDVTLLSLLRPNERELIPEAAELGCQVIPILFLDRQAQGSDRAGLIWDRAGAWRRSLCSGYPAYVQKYWSRSLSRRVIEAVAENRPDAVQIEYLQLSLLVRDLRRWRDARAGSMAERLRPRLILNSHELGSLPRQRRAEMARNPAARALFRAEARAWERLQVAATGWADVTLCVTDQDRQMLDQMGGKYLKTMPLGIDTDSVKPIWAPTGPPKFLFVGSFAHRPNRSAAKFLVDKVWPLVAQYAESGQLLLAGRGSRAFIRALGDEDPRIRALGFVEDLSPLYRECRLFVAPLTEGGGIKIKILEAMAHGIPVVTTPIGIEGIVDSAEEAAIIAEPDAAFAKSIIQALDASDEVRLRAGRARRIIEERFSWSAITEKLTCIYEGR